MSSDIPGGKPTLVLKQKTPPTYPGNAIKSVRDADYAGAMPMGATLIKLGIRVKSTQVPTLVLRTRGTIANPPGDPVPLTGPLPDTDPILADLRDGLGCNGDEKWFAYTLNWVPAFKLKFDSTLTLAPFNPPSDNGFEIVTVVFCHASQTFKTGVYSYAISVLPGKKSLGFPTSAMTASAPETATKSARKPKAKAKAKSKGKKKSRR